MRIRAEPTILLRGDAVKTECQAQIGEVAK